MEHSAKITRKGQVTIPRKFRESLKTDIVEFLKIKGGIVIKPVENVAGVLFGYAKGQHDLKSIREKVWKQVGDEKK